MEARFYPALANGAMKSSVYMTAPVIMTEEKFQEALKHGNGTAKKKMLLPFAKLMCRIYPKLKLPIRL
ncbi:hypothetical protein [Chitinophaga sp. CF418]|uniref:hypothetical protein n=1 Tax=Chitinophaga sp. CF418 TaxID=1855287 RepID=UPI00122D3573|nr:hypothetical protein [Chitinophaga sp. CF418]